MRIAVAKEAGLEERRTALTPDGVKELKAKGVEIVVQAGAGEGAYFSDQSFSEVGAEISADPQEVFAKSDLIVKVGVPTPDEISQMRKGVSLISFLYPLTNPSTVTQLKEQGVTSFAMDMIPRISRAQSMDALSSMSTIAGYKAVLLAAEHLPKFFPMLMTAAGTLPPAKVFVIGAGVAGLQSIATSRRLGALVEAFDVRPAVKEQIESLGAKFVGLSIVSDEAEDSGGYAKEVSQDTHTKELELIGSRLPNIDVVITTALIPGKQAPVLITDKMLQNMKPGSVIVDLAAPAGGNCEGVEPGKIVVKHGVTLIGRTDLVASMSEDASRMYSKNITSFLGTFLKDAALNIDMEDEIIKGTLVTHEGKIVHETTRLAIERGGKA